MKLRADSKERRLGGEQKNGGTIAEKIRTENRMRRAYEAADI